jgi:GTP cyclohydrolase IB
MDEISSYEQTHKQMNAPDRITLPDIQSRLDTRNTAIDAVGIKEVRHPMMILTGTGSLPTIATLSMTVPVTSLCPCSKEISEYGAHNQRSHITIDAEIAGEMAVGELITVAEQSASCEVYSLLKRPDEKYVTERAYDNPKFVEDLVRDVAIALNKQQRLVAFTVEAENFESIHNHSAFARVVRSNSEVTPEPTLAKE